MKRIWKAREERGAILVMAVFGVTLAIVASALAVDLGSIAQERRRDQKVADLAALDAVRDIPNAQTRAQASATRNSFPSSSGYSVAAVEGTKVGGTCVSQPGSGSVCVTVTSPIKNSFVPGSNTVIARAVASAQAQGGFMIGSSLVTLDSSRSTLLNKFLGGMLKGSDLSLSLVNYQGLAGANVTLDALRQQLLSMGVSAGNLSSLLSSNITAAQLLQATAQALTAKGDVADASVLNALRLTITNSTQFTLGKLIHVATGADNTALASNINVFQLVTAAAEVANGSNFIDIPSVNITVPGVLGTEVKLQVIQPPQFYFGPVGGSVSTAQISLTVVTNLNLNLTVAGLVGAVATGKLPVQVTGAGAKGTLKSAQCGASSSMTVTVDPTAFSGSATTDANGIVVSATLPLLGNVPLVRVPVTDAVPSVDGPPVDKTWSYPSQFPPPLGTTTTQHAGSQPIGLQSLTNITTGNPVLLGALPVPVGTVTSALTSALSPLLGNVDNTILTPLLTALGIDVGSADVTALSMQCGNPALTA